MAKKNLTTPKGVAVYPHLSRPDTKFNKDGVWHTKLRLEGADAKQLVADIAAAQKANVAEQTAKLKEKGGAAAKKALKLADLPWQRETDDDDKPTGAVVFSFKMNATGKTKEGEVYKRQPAIFDKSGTPVKDLKIGGGSVIRVSYQLNPFYTPALGAGISLRMYAVQVIELVEFGGNAEYFGFENEGEDEVEAKAAAGSNAGEATEEEAEEEEKGDF